RYDEVPAETFILDLKTRETAAPCQRLANSAVLNFKNIAQDFPRPLANRLVELPPRFHSNRFQARKLTFDRRPGQETEDFELPRRLLEALPRGRLALFGKIDERGSINALDQRTQLVQILVPGVDTDE